MATEEKPKTEEKNVEAKPKVKTEAKDSKAPEKKTEAKVEKKPVAEKPKKTEAVVEGNNLHISTKKSADICKFIKKKRIGDAIRELEMVPSRRLAVPMKGELPHRKGKIMSGGFPKNASIDFVKLLKSLAANADHNGLVEPVIVEAIANLGSRPYGRFGQERKKRTHVRIVAKEKSMGGKK